MTRFGRRPPGCGTCAHFLSDRQGLEDAMPNLAALASAYAAVTAGDGLCRLHDTYQSPRSRCADHLMRLPAPP